MIKKCYGAAFRKPIEEKSEYDVKSIAVYLAFCSQSHFGKVFKDQTGLTPTKYREKFGQFQKTKIYDN